MIALAFAIGAVAVLTLTSKGRENLAALISDFASTPDSQVTITGIEWHLVRPFPAGSAGSGGRGWPWLAANGIEVEWSPIFLAPGRVQRRADCRAKSGACPPADGIRRGRRWRRQRRCRSTFRSSALSLPDIALGSAVTGGQVASVAANGKAMAQGVAASVAADLNVERTDGTAGELLASI